MNPWWEKFLARVNREHDRLCDEGTDCPDRERHILGYAVRDLREVVDAHPDAQADAVSGRPR